MKTSICVVIGTLVVAGCGTDPNGSLGAGHGGTTDTSSDGGTVGANDDGGSTTMDGGSPTKPQTPPTHLLSGLAVDEVAIFQAVKISVVKAGVKATSTTPIVAGRDGLVRLYVKPASGWTSKSVTAVLSLTAADGTAFPQVTSTKTIGAASTSCTQPASAPMRSQSWPPRVHFPVRTCRAE